MRSIHLQVGAALILLGLLVGCDYAPQAPAPTPVEAAPAPSVEQTVEETLKKDASLAARVFSAYAPMPGDRTVDYPRGSIRSIRVQETNGTMTLSVDWDAVPDNRLSFTATIDTAHATFYEEFVRASNRPGNHKWRSLDRVVISAFAGDSNSLAYQTEIGAEGLYELSRCHAPGISCGTARSIPQSLWRVTASDETVFRVHWMTFALDHDVEIEEEERKESCPKCPDLASLVGGP